MTLSLFVWVMFLLNIIMHGLRSQTLTFVNEQDYTIFATIFVMIQLTKIFRFELAHAIHGYPGACRNIHGHSYKLHVTVSSAIEHKEYIPPPGFVIDFKELKHLVKFHVIEKYDHKLILSEAFLKENASFASQENLIIWAAEPTAENLLISVKQILFEKFPEEIKLIRLKLYETADSYAEWMNDPK